VAPECVAGSLGILRPRFHEPLESTTRLRFEQIRSGLLLELFQKEFGALRALAQQVLDHLPSLNRTDVNAALAGSHREIQT